MLKLICYFRKHSLKDCFVWAKEAEQLFRNIKQVNQMRGRKINIRKILLILLIIGLFFSGRALLFAMIIIDPGHGGSDPGATATQDSTTIKEKNLNLKVALLLAEELKRRGYSIKMTRETDVYVTLSERSEISNTSNADIFVSIHQNSFTSSSARGVEVYYYPGSVFGKALAEKLSTSLSEATGLKNRGAKEANFYVLRNTKAIAVLVECGFMSNPDELRLLTNPDFQKKVANAAASAIDKFVLEDLYSSKIERFNGRNRYETSAEISKALFSAAESAIIVSGDAYPDAVVASALAGYLNGPILLSNSNSLPGVIESELVRLKAKKVYIIGGTGVVSESVASKIKSRGVSVYRIAGIDRYKTAIEVAKYLNSHSKINGVFLVNGMSFADAVAASNLAGAAGFPILFTNRTRCPESVVDFINSLQSGREEVEVIAIGGTAVISDSAYEVFEKGRRIYGSDRYETSVLVQKEAISRFKFGVEKTCFANGVDFSDALCMSTAGFGLRSVLLLTPPDRLNSKTRNFISENSKQISRFLLAGGDKAITISCAREIAIAHLNQ